MKAYEFFNTAEGKKYLDLFKDELFVVKYGGAALENEKMMGYFLEDVASMQQHGIKIVIVHGGGKKLSRIMKELQIPVEFENGFRKTTEKTVKLAADVFNDLNQLICNYLNYLGTETTSYTYGNGIECRLIDQNRVENRVGIVSSINILFDHHNKIPVISSIGQSIGEPDDKLLKGEYLNLNADYLSVEIALKLKARKIIFISDVNGIYLKPQDSYSKIDHITENEIKELIDKNILTGGMRLKIEMSLRALKGGIKKVHYIDGRIKHSFMKEIFTDKGIGTEIVHS